MEGGLPDEILSQIETCTTKWFSSSNEFERRQAQERLCRLYDVMPDGPVSEPLSCEQLASVPSCIPKHEEVIKRSNNQFAVLFSAGCLIATIDRHWRSFSLERVADMRAFALSALSSKGEHLPRVAVLKLSHFLCRLTKLGWRSDPLHSKTVDVMLSFLGKPGPLAEIALETVEMMIAEMQEPHPVLEDRGIIRMIMFRDTSLKRVFHAGLAILRRLRGSTPDPQEIAKAVAVGATAFPDITRISMGSYPSESDFLTLFTCLHNPLGKNVTAKVVKVVLACLTYDFSGMGSGVIEEEVMPIPVPSNWKALRDPRNAELFFELFHASVKEGLNEGSDSLAVLSLQCVVQIASIRASLFFGPSRDQHVNSLLTETIRVMKGRRDLLVNSDGIHELCRLLFRLRSHNQMSILSRCDRFEEWLRETAAFTEECFFVWDQVSNNSLTYLLLLWSNLVSPGSMLRPPLRKLLWECYSKVATGFIQSRLLLCDAAAKAAVTDAPPGALSGKGPWANPGLASVSDAGITAAPLVVEDLASNEDLVKAHASNIASLCKYNLEAMSEFLITCITESLECFPTPDMAKNIPKDALEQLVSAAQARIGFIVFITTAISKVANSSMSLGKGPYSWSAYQVGASNDIEETIAAHDGMETDMSEGGLHEGLEAIPEGGDEGDSEQDRLQAGVDGSLASALELATPNRRSASHDGLPEFIPEGARSAPGPATGKRYKKRLTLDMWMGSPLMERFGQMKLEGSQTDVKPSYTAERSDAAMHGRKLSFGSQDEGMPSSQGIPFGKEEEYGLSSENALLSQMNALLTLDSTGQTDSLMAPRHPLSTASTPSYASHISAAMNVIAQTSPMVTTFTTTTSTYKGDSSGMSAGPGSLHSSVEGSFITTQTKPWDKIIQSSPTFESDLTSPVEVRNPIYEVATTARTKRHACRHLVANLAEKILFIVQLLRASGPTLASTEGLSTPEGTNPIVDVDNVGKQVLEYMEQRAGASIKKPLGVVVSTTRGWSPGRELLELSCFRFLQFFAEIYAQEREEQSKRNRVQDLLGLSVGMVAAWNLGGTDRVRYLLSQGANALRSVADKEGSLGRTPSASIAGDITLGAVGMTQRLLGLKEPSALLDLLLAKSVDVLRLPAAPSVRIVSAALDTFRVVTTALLDGVTPASSMIFPVASKSGITASSDLLCTTVVRALIQLRKPLAQAFPVLGEQQYLRERTGLYATLTQLVMLHTNKIALATSPLMSDIIRQSQKLESEGAEESKSSGQPQGNSSIEAMISKVFAAPNDPSVTTNGFYEYGTEDSSWFRAFIAPLDAVGRSLHGCLQHSRLSDKGGVIGVKAFDISTLVGWLRDVTGIFAGTNAAQEYNLAWDWFKTRHLWMLPDLATLFRQHYGVLVSLSRLVEEIVYNRKNRITFGPISDSGYVLFRTSVQVLHTLAVHTLLDALPSAPGHSPPGPSLTRSQRLKIARVIFCSAARLFSGGYVNFGVMELYQDEHPDMLESVVLQLTLAVEEHELRRFPKIAVHLNAAVERLVSRNPENIFTLQGRRFRALVKRLLMGCRSEETISTAQACSALMCLGEAIYNAVTFDKTWMMSCTGRANQVPGAAGFIMSTRSYDTQKAQIERLRQCIMRLNKETPEVWEDIVSTLLIACVHDNVQHLWGLSRALLPFVLCFPNAVAASVNTVLASLGVEVTTAPSDGSGDSGEDQVLPAYTNRMKHYILNLIGDAYRTPARVLNKKGIPKESLPELDVDNQGDPSATPPSWPHPWPEGGQTFATITIPASGPPALALTFPCKDHFMRDVRVMRLMLKRKPTTSLQPLGGRAYQSTTASWTGATTMYASEPFTNP